MLACLRGFFVFFSQKCVVFVISFLLQYLVSEQLRGHGNRACNLLRQSKIRCKKKTQEKNPLSSGCLAESKRLYCEHVFSLCSRWEWRAVEGIQGTWLYIHTRPGHPLCQETRFQEEWGRGIKTTSGQLHWGVGRLGKGVSSLLIGNYPRQTLSFLCFRVRTFNNALFCMFHGSSWNKAAELQLSSKELS